MRIIQAGRLPFIQGIKVFSNFEAGVVFSNRISS